MSSDAETLLATGAEALAAGDWVGARDAFGAALASEASAEALDGLGEASWWLGETHEGVELRERAYAAFRQQGDAARAVATALWLRRNHLANFGNVAAAAGWLARARRLVDEHDLGWLHGRVLVDEADAADDPTVGETLARQAYELGLRDEDLDLQLCALSQIGATLIGQGRIADGLPYLDEAMAGTLGGEGRHRDTVVFTSCTTMISCTTCAEFERAVQWIRATDRLSQRYGNPFLYAECRLLYGSVLVSLGDWVQAEEELRSAVATSRDGLPALRAEALASLASLRLDQGRIEEAERLVAGLEDQPAVVPMVARIHLLRGRPETAANALRRQLRQVAEGSLERLLLLDTLGRAELDRGDTAAGADHGIHLMERGASLGCDLAVAYGARLRGEAMLAVGDADGARAHLDQALAVFARLSMPLEAQRTRLLLARSFVEDEPAVAADEARTALTTFDALGAQRDANAAADLLRSLGTRASRGGSRGRQTLTDREQEVLALLGEGLSNPQIADRLYISRRTVEQHVARVLSKLGVDNRAAAAAEAVRQQERT